MAVQTCVLASFRSQPTNPPRPRARQGLSRHAEKAITYSSTPTKRRLDRRRGGRDRGVGVSATHSTRKRAHVRTSPVQPNQSNAKRTQKLKPSPFFVLFRFLFCFAFRPRRGRPFVFFGQAPLRYSRRNRRWTNARHPTASEEPPARAGAVACLAGLLWVAGAGTREQGTDGRRRHGHRKARRQKGKQGPTPTRESEGEAAHDASRRATRNEKKTEQRKQTKEQGPPGPGPAQFGFLMFLRLLSFFFPSPSSFVCRCCLLFVVCCLLFVVCCRCCCCSRSRIVFVVVLRPFALLPLQAS